jgi:serine/threonine protein kinase
MMAAVFNRLGPYEIHEEVGRGGMASVLLATDTRTNRRVALRLVSTREAPDVLSAEQRGAELQEQFCRVSSFVPELYERGSTGGYLYVAMEFVDGENLSEVIRRGPLVPPRAVEIALELCRFLEDARSF